MPSPPRFYPTDLSDTEWALLAPMIPPPKPGGRPPKWTRRELLDGIFYLVRSGCQWRLLPHEFPPWQTVYHYFRCWRLDGTWEDLNTTLRELERTRQGRDPQPSGCILDSQSVRTTSAGGIRGYDGAKKLNGRKRHLLVDTVGLVLTARVHAADIQDRVGVPLVLTHAHEVFPRLAHIWLDQGYTGSGRAWIEQTLGWEVEIVKRPPLWHWCPPGEEPPARPRFTVLPRRWVVERTFAWLGQSRRLSKDYERLPGTSEAMIHLAMSRIMLKRLAVS
jgi:putative transposase